MIGRTVGKYRVVGQLGRGGMGTVYRAVDVMLDREVAIKVLNPEIADLKVIKRFRTEATTLAKLNHPGIATIYDLFPSDADLLIVMELVRGETLEKILIRVGALPPDHAAYVADRILSALEHAHRVGIVHCDIKPANVMVTEHGAVKIMDFGTARVRGGTRSTIDSYMMGTPAYMAPEQVLSQDFDGRVDLYAMGVVLYRMLAGTLPFDADTAIALVQKQISEAPTPLATHREGLPEWCESIAQRALAKSPGDRFQTAEEFREMLGKVAAVVPTTELLQAVSLSIDDGDTATPAEQSPLEHFGLTPVPTPVAHTVVLAEPDPYASSSGWVPNVGRAVHRIWNRGFWTTHAQTAATVLADRRYTPIGALLVFALAGLVMIGLWRPARVAVTSALSGPLGVVGVKKFGEPFVFEAKALMTDGIQPRERRARVTLADAKITVEANGKVLQEVSYHDVLSISYSRGSDPVWNTPAGPTRVMRVSGGALRAFGITVTRDWVTIHTANATGEFVVLRFDDESRARRALAALEERTGRTAEIVTARLR